MFQRILVPLDGSKRAEHALTLAARLAAAHGGSLVLVRVVSESLYATTTYGYSYVESPAELTDEAEAYLKDIASRPELGGVHIDSLAAVGTPAVEILEAAHEQQVDGIVMCSHGRNALAKWAMGSVAQKVGRHAPVPVLVLKEGATDPTVLSADPTHSLRVLLPLDGSPLAEAAIAPALSLIAGLAAGRAVEIHLLRVVDLTTVYGRAGEDSAAQDQAMRTAFTASAREYLRVTADQVRRQLPVGLGQTTISWSVATGIDAAALIVEMAHGRAAHASGEPSPTFDLIAMATHGRGGIGLWAVGSVTERVLTTSPLPLLIVRPPHELGRTEIPAAVHAAPTFPPLL